MPGKSQYQLAYALAAHDYAYNLRTLSSTHKPKCTSRTATIDPARTPLVPFSGGTVRRTQYP
jgi:hypothetical protein